MKNQQLFLGLGLISVGIAIFVAASKQGTANIEAPADPSIAPDAQTSEHPPAAHSASAATPEEQSPKNHPTERPVPQPAKLTPEDLPPQANEIAPNASASSTLQTEKEPAPATSRGDEFPLRLGSRGPRVERLRVWLMRNFGAAGIVTQEFDAFTEGQVLKYLKVSEVSKALFDKHQMGNRVHQQRALR